MNCDVNIFNYGIVIVLMLKPVRHSVYKVILIVFLLHLWNTRQYIRPELSSKFVNPKRESERPGWT